MKKLAAMILTIMLFCTACAPAMSGNGTKETAGANVSKSVKLVNISFAVGEDKLTINDKKVTVRTPYLVNDTILVPVRVITEAFGAKVGWEGESQTVSIDASGMAIKLTIGSKNATVNGKNEVLLAAAELATDTTMVPLRFISETFGAEVTYDDNTQKIGVFKRVIFNAAEIDTDLLEQAKKLVLNKVKKINSKAGDQFPKGTKDGVYVMVDVPDWTVGYYPGINYLSYDMSQDKQYLSAARKASEKIRTGFLNDRQCYMHDLGFVFMNSYYKEYLETGSQDALAMVIDAGDAMLERVKPTGYIQAWNVFGKGLSAQENKNRMLADTMCNLDLLFVCSELTGDKKYADAAVKHAQMTQQYIIRPDYTTAHTFVFNPDGTPKYERTAQGYSDSSCWARGQAWVIYGMAQCYNATGDKSFLESAKKCADVFFEKTEDDLIPKWDMIFTGDAKEPRDTSAASITACGLLDIYKATGDTFYKDAAYTIYSTLYNKYAMNYTDEGIIGQAVANMPAGTFVNSSIIYGEYYFAELTKRFFDLAAEK